MAPHIPLKPTISSHLPSDTERPPSRAEALEATWREYYRLASEAPRNPAARDFLHQDLITALARMIPADASVLEVGCGEGDLLAALPNARKQGIDYLPETVARARARHPEIGFELGDAISPPPNLVHRADDRPEALATRFAAYRNQTAPILPYYRDRGILTPVDGMADIDEVTRQIEAILAR